MYFAHLLAQFVLEYVDVPFLSLSIIFSCMFNSIITLIKLNLYGIKYTALHYIIN